MRRYLLVCTVFGWLLAALPALAQTYPSEAVILQSEVEVRSGPSKTFYPTSKLHSGDKVIVIRECKDSAGWLEIKPPPGSFSWINGKYVKQVDTRYAYVDAEAGRPAPVLPGSTLVNQEPNRESMKLTAGTIVVIVDRPLTINGEKWLPIQPHPSEVRYIPVEAIRPPTQVATVNSAPNWTLTPNGYASNPTLAEAEQALKAGNVSRARELFQHVANTTTDANQKVFALNRLHHLPSGANPPVHTTSAQKPSEPVTANASPNAQGNLLTLQGASWSSYGRLRETLLKRDDGQPIYVLEDAQGRPMSYVTTSQGKSLQSYVGRMVAVYGPTMYRPDSAVRMQFIVVTHVAVP